MIIEKKNVEFHVQYELEEPPPPSPDGDKNFLTPPLLGNPGYAPAVHRDGIKWVALLGEVVEVVL